MSTSLFFPTLIYQTKIDFDNSALREKALKLKEESQMNTSWFCDTYNSIGKYNIAEDESLTPLVDSFLYHTKLFAKEYGIQDPKIKSKDGWVNVAMTGDYQEFHLHPNSHFSMAYYIDVQENCGNIIFRSPESNTDMFQLPQGNLSFASMKTVSVKPENNKLIIFRSNILHMVEKNRNVSPRVSLSMNVVLQE